MTPTRLDGRDILRLNQATGEVQIMATSVDNDASFAEQYNDATKLQYINLGNKPPLYKSYPNLRNILLPDVAGRAAMDTAHLGCYPSQRQCRFRR